MNHSALRASVRWMAGAAVVCAALACGGPAGTVRADGDEKPKPPKSVGVQALVIMASKGKDADVDSSLGEIAGLLEKNFAGMFNRFHLRRTAGGDVKLEKTATLALIDNYHLKAAYDGAEVDDRKQVKIRLTCTLVKRVQVTENGKKKDKDVPVAGPIRYTVPPGLFCLIAGPKVGDETMILAVQVRK